MTLGTTIHSEHDDDYDVIVDLVQARFEALVKAGRPMFTTDATGLFEVLLAALPEERCQTYTCSACRKFFERYGGLVVIDDRHQHASVLWDVPLSAPLGEVARALEPVARAVRKARITGVFLSSGSTLGRPSAGGWRHFAVDGARVHQGLLTAAQVMAAKREEYATLVRSLEEFPIELVRQAHTMLSTGSLYRSEKCIGVARWLLDLHEARGATQNAVQRENLTWLAVAGAPAGFCHVRSGMIGTLLEDLAAGLPFDAIKLRFDAKMHPLQYQRPTAAPSAGNLAQAEKIVVQLRTAGALERRFARLDDIDALWRYEKPHEPKHEGVFGHLKAKMKKTPSVELPPIPMTWEKFSRTVLPQAATLEYFVPEGRTGYLAIVTAADPEAPPIVQWDRLDRRNPATWYLYHGGSRGSRWNLKEGAWCRVEAVTYRPSMWYGAQLPHQGKGVIFVLEGCRDLDHTKGGGFFPEQLKNEYHAIRKTMEAYAANATIAGRDEASACGRVLEAGSGTWSDSRFRVTDRAGQVVVYELDRWD